MRTAHEDVRLKPHDELTQELLSSSLEEELGYNSNDPGDANSTHPTMNQIDGCTLMVTTKQPKYGEKDIGKYVNNLHEDREIRTTVLSDTSRIMEDIYSEIGAKQVTRRKLSFSPPRILDSAFKKEYESSWHDSNEPNAEAEVPSHANVLTSHVIYKFKTDEQQNRTPKERIVPHGNHDCEKDIF